MPTWPRSAASGSPRSDATLSAFTLTQPGNIRISLQGLSTATQLAGDDAQTLSSRYQMKVETLNLESEEDSLALTEGNLDLALKRAGSGGVSDTAGGERSAVDESAIQEALDKMLQRGVTLQLTDFSAPANGEPVSLQGRPGWRQRPWHN